MSRPCLTEIACHCDSAAIPVSSVTNMAPPPLPSSPPLLPLRLDVSGVNIGNGWVNGSYIRSYVCTHTAWCRTCWCYKHAAMGPAGEVYLWYDARYSTWCFGPQLYGDIIVAASTTCGPPIIGEVCKVPSDASLLWEVHNESIKTIPDSSKTLTGIPCEGVKISEVWPSGKSHTTQAIHRCGM